MKRTRSLLADEWQLTVRRPKGAGRRRATVRIEGANPRDRLFAKALARLAELWLRSRR